MMHVKPVGVCQSACKGFILAHSSVFLSFGRLFRMTITDIIGVSNGLNPNRSLDSGRIIALFPGRFLFSFMEYGGPYSQ